MKRFALQRIPPDVKTSRNMRDAEMGWISAKGARADDSRLSRCRRLLRRWRILLLRLLVSFVKRPQETNSRPSVDPIAEAISDHLRGRTRAHRRSQDDSLA